MRLPGIAGLSVAACSVNVMGERVLLVVDVQVDVMEESVGSDAVIANVAKLVEAARAADAPVVWVQHSDAGLAKGSAEWQIVPQLSPADNEAIVHKTWSDSFVETDLAQQLEALGAREIVLAGAQTDACIRSTFYGGIHRGYDVTLVSDAHTTGDLRQWGAEFSPEQSIAVLNAQAAYTKQPAATGAVTTTAEAFA